MSMSKKDFVALAEAIRSERPCTLDERSNSPDPHLRGAYDEWGTMTLAICSVLARTNESFNRQRFLDACGVQQ